MNWSDERYVRLYTRDTVTWKRWTWEARALFPLLLRRVDRSGILDAGSGDKAEALALMLEVPIDVAVRVLPQWLASDTVRESGRALVVPSFIEAQEATQSDRQRQAESRARRRTNALSSQVVDSTTSHVTSSHETSQHVTPAVPCRAEPAVKDMSGTPDVTQPEFSLTPETPKPTPALEDKLTDEEFQVFEHWRTTRNHPKAKATPERKRAIAKALKHYSVEDLQRAITGLSKSRFHMGDNNGHKVYDSIELCLRDAAHIEDFMKLAGAA